MTNNVHRPLLAVKNLHTCFKTKKGLLHAVDGISYELEYNDSLGVVGESGSGKSVHALSIMRLIPDPPGKIVDGEIWFEGKNLLSTSKKELRNIRGKEIAMIFQDPLSSLNPVLTIGDQLTESMIIHQNMKKRDAYQRAQELLELVEIPDSKNRLENYPHQFSGGMRQRVMIAMALSCNPKILIADEPTTALDVTIQAQIIDLIKRLQEKFRMSVIWITHDLGIVARISKRINVMYAGNIVEMGDSRSIYKHTMHPYTVSLLKSIPNLYSKGKEKLYTIPGAPPDLVGRKTCCPFYERCFMRGTRCSCEKPELVEVAETGHWVACFNWKKVLEQSEDRA